MENETTPPSGVHDAPVYPTIRDAVFSAVMDWFGWDESNSAELLEATDLTNGIMRALCRSREIAKLTKWRNIADTLAERLDPAWMWPDDEILSALAAYNAAKGE